MDKQKTGELIREARMKSNYTQSELGDLLGVSNKAVSRWENGETFPDVGVLESLSNVLGLSINDIVTGSVSEEDSDTIIEVVRIAKMQKKQKRDEIIKLVLGIVALIYICFLGYAGLSSAGFNVNAYALYGMSYFVMSTIAAFFFNSGNNFSSQKNNKFGMGQTIVSSVSFLSELVLLIVSFSMINNGKNPFNRETAKVGPAINIVLTLLFIINLLFLTVNLYMIVRNNAKTNVNVFVSLAVCVFSGMNGLILHNLTTAEGAVRIFWNNFIIVFSIMIAEIVMFEILRRRRKD